MNDDDSAGFGVDFTINPSESFEMMAQLLAVMSSAEGKILASATKVEGSTSYMVKLDGPAASLKQFATTATREMTTVRSALDGAGLSVEALARAASQTAGMSIVGPAETGKAAALTSAINATEKAIERRIFAITKEAAAVGRTKAELRAKADADLIATAATQGNTAAVEDLHAALRNLEAVRQSHAEDKGAAEDAEAAAVAKEAQALREAALAFDMFEAAARKGAAAQREFEAAQAQAARDDEAQRLREAAFAYGKFEAAARKGAAAQREFEAAQAMAARDDEAQRLRSAAFAHDQFEATVRRGAQAMREEEAAAASDAAALARLRAMLDPAATAHARLNAELAEARRVMTAAGASAEELARAESMLVDRANLSAQTHGAMAGAARKNGTALQTIAVQLPDITQGLLTGQKPMQVFIQQGAQIFQVAQMGQGGLRGFGKEVAGLALRFAPVLIGMAAVGAGFALFNRWVNEGVKSDQLTRDLGKITGGANATKAELYKLKDETVTWADTSKALFSVVGKDISNYFVGDMKGMSKGVKGVLDDLTSYMRQTLAGIYAGVAGTKAYLGEIEKGGVLGIGKMLIGQGDPKLLDKTYGAAYDAADKYLTKLGTRVKSAAIDNARERIAKSIGYNDIPKPKTDKHAEALARDAEATEAQIRNLYKLADAYGVSGAAALIAEARVKAESKAIKQQADIEAAVNRQIRLEIAQRVSDSAKAAASMLDQARVQTEVNALVAAGNVPAERAAELVQERIADLPLLAAIEVAQQRGLKAEVDKATAALKAQQDARGTAKAAEVGAFYAGADQQADRQLAMQREELRLVGATDMARVQAMAKLQAEQTLQAKGYELGTAYANNYIGKQVDIAVGAETNRQAQDAWNASLTATADLFDTIDQTAQRAAQGMADAFGSVGSAIGDALTVMTGYYADQAKLQESHEAAIRAAGKDQVRIDRENRLFSLRSSSQQIAAFGDMASAAKGFFKEGSSGYKAMAAAEKVYRFAQLAMSIQAMVQNALETTTHVASAAARATADGTAGIAAQSKLPFPANIAAMAATGAALVAAGIAVFAGGGGAKSAPVTNTGTGTVLGDPSAKSDSIKNAIDALKEVDTLTNTFAREMAASLKSIDSQIGGVASLVARAGNIDASTGVNEGFKANAIGSVLSKIPVIGGILGGLFGTKTSVIGTGLSGGPQSVGNILGNGFDASYYSDIEKKKKLFGITTSTKTSTQYSAADPGLSNQLTLILKSFNDAIAAAAGPLGVATGDVQARLNGFVVNIGKIDLKGLTGQEIQEKLSAVFGAAADGMAAAAFPGLEQFQKVGEGVFETLVRVASTVEAVGASLDMLGTNAQTMGIGVKLALADQFESVSALTDAASAYFQTYYSKEEQAAAKTAQMSGVFASLGVAMPATLSAFRALVEAQDLTTSAGQSTYATLLKLAPAFAELQTSMAGAKSAADILSERQDLERQLLEQQGNTAALRALDLAKLDETNRALQLNIWALADQKVAQDAATAAAKAAADAESAIAAQRDGLNRQLLQLQGDTAAIRALDLDKLDESNRALQMNIWAITDQNAALAAQKTAQDEAAASAKALADATAQQRDGLNRQLLQLQGDTAAIRALDLAGLDASNRALQEQIYALQDAQTAAEAAAQAAQALADAWGAVGTSISDEIKRIRGLADTGTANSFATLQGQFNAATNAARGGDIEAAKLLPGLSQSLLTAAADAATSRQELARVQAMTAASLEATNEKLGQAPSEKISTAALLAVAATNQSASTSAANNAEMINELAMLREEVRQMRSENNTGNAAIAGEGKRTNRILDNVTQENGGNAVTVLAA
ncbi:hypothetical protein [Sphingomonas sp. PP-CE-1G-424]|uniref:hypothetical protein n=1 Tax=Sphingomonas sp. PP-CE-1G-424 TaxID=2135658 RepID=UPI00105647D5|nr:hypothetical protein [Sphingomonas sp. PP-CE-1G-424]TCP71820.1 hypothetical protein C8J43_102905 [Sphingomonas sp. PP-CE-1G-424]